MAIRGTVTDSASDVDWNFRPEARNTLVGVLAVWLLLLTTGIALLAGTGIRLNLSGSLPLGFYRLTAAGIERGALVAVCLDLPHPVLQRTT